MSNTDTTYYTTWGNVRLGCGHAHRTIETARACLRRDIAGCVAQGGYSDRHIRTADMDEIRRGRSQPGEILADTV